MIYAHVKYLKSQTEEIRYYLEVEEKMTWCHHKNIIRGAEEVLATVCNSCTGSCLAKKFLYGLNCSSNLCSLHTHFFIQSSKSSGWCCENFAR